MRGTQSHIQAGETGGVAPPAPALRCSAPCRQPAHSAPQAHPPIRRRVPRGDERADPCSTRPQGRPPGRSRPRCRHRLQPLACAPSERREAFTIAPLSGALAALFKNKPVMRARSFFPPSRGPGDGTMPAEWASHGGGTFECRALLSRTGGLHRGAKAREKVSRTLPSPLKMVASQVVMR